MNSSSWSFHILMSFIESKRVNLSCNSSMTTRCCAAMEHYWSKTWNEKSIEGGVPQSSCTVVMPSFSPSLQPSGMNQGVKAPQTLLNSLPSSCYWKYTMAHYSGNSTQNHSNPAESAEKQMWKYKVELSFRKMLINWSFLDFRPWSWLERFPTQGLTSPCCSCLVLSVTVKLQFLALLPIQTHLYMDWCITLFEMDPSNVLPNHLHAHR